MAVIALEFWRVLAEMAPYLLLGFFVAGLLSVLVPTRFVERHLGGRGFFPPLKASLLGIPLPLCSCGVIPVTAALKRQGASRGAATSFLLSTPQTGVDSILVTYSLLGPVFTVYRVAVAFVTGVFGGWLADLVDGKDNSRPAADLEEKAGSETGDNCGCESGIQNSGEHGVWAKTGQALNYGFVTLPRDIGKALLVGLLIAGVISALVPPDYFGGVLGGGILAMVLMMAAGIPVYVCATASVPVAAALIAAGVSPGAALVFLVTGPATNAAAVTTLWRVLGALTTLIYLGTVAVGALLSGLLLDAVYSAVGVASLPHHHAAGVPWWQAASAVVLLLLLANALLPRKRAPEELAMEADGQKTVLKVEGMTCSHCAGSVQQALSEQSGVTHVQVDLNSGTATVLGRGFSLNSLLQAVESAGYRAKPE